jgi:hypothetical protein
MNPRIQKDRIKMRKKKNYCYGDFVKSMTDECCLTCRFYRTDRDTWLRGDSYGWCHRQPPVVGFPQTVYNGDPAEFEHPGVHWLTWCGEWTQDTRTDPWDQPPKSTLINLMEFYQDEAATKTENKQKGLAQTESI